MLYLQLTGFIIFFLASMSSAVAGEIRGETDACLVTLYNYPAETPKYDVPTKAPTKSPLVLEKNNRSSKTNENVHSRMSLSSQRPSEQ